MHNEGGARRLAEPEDTTALPHQNTTAPSGSTSRPPHAPARPEGSPHLDSAVQEAEVLRRKEALAQTLKAIPKEDRTDIEYSKFISDAETELAAADKAIQLDKFAAAALCLDHVEAALDGFLSSRQKYPKYNPSGTSWLMVCVCFFEPLLQIILSPALLAFFWLDGKGESVILFTILLPIALSSFLLWRFILRERILSFYRVKIPWRIEACTFALFHAFLQTVVLRSIFEGYVVSPLMVNIFSIGWPIIAFVYPIVDVIVTRRRRMRKPTA